MFYVFCSVVTKILGGKIIGLIRWMYVKEYWYLPPPYREYWFSKNPTKTKETKQIQNFLKDTFLKDRKY